MSATIGLRLAQRTVVTATGCIEWRGARNEKGYGVLGVGSRKDGTRRTRTAHRAAWELYVGPVERGLELDHTCRNRACVNVAHLEQVPHATNVQRADFSARSARLRAVTHCKRGHLFDAANTRITPSGTRACRACRRDLARKYRAAERAS